MEHVNYPHTPGHLYDCQACEDSCHCKPGAAECVWIGHGPVEETSPQTITHAADLDEAGQNLAACGAADATPDQIVSDGDATCDDCQSIIG